MRKPLIIAFSCIAALACAFAIWMLLDSDAYIAIFRPVESWDFVERIVMPIKR